MNAKATLGIVIILGTLALVYRDEIWPKPQKNTAKATRQVDWAFIAVTKRLSETEDLRLLSGFSGSELAFIQPPEYCNSQKKEWLL